MQIGFNLSLRQKLQHPDMVQAQTKENNYKPPQLAVQDLVVIKDPDMETKRQAYEGTTYPSIIEKARTETRSYNEAAFERTGRISELHYGQIVYSYQRGANTVLKVPTADMLVVPTGFTAEKESELLSIVARYKSGELPRRDVQFLEDVKSILVKGMGLVAARGARRSKRDAMVENLTRASEATDRPGDVVAQV